MTLYNEYLKNPALHKLLSLFDKILERDQEDELLGVYRLISKIEPEFEIRLSFGIWEHWAYISMKYQDKDFASFSINDCGYIEIIDQKNMIIDIGSSKEPASCILSLKGPNYISFNLNNTPHLEDQLVKIKGNCNE